MEVQKFMDSENHLVKYLFSSIIQSQFKAKMKIFKFKINGNTYETEIIDIEDNIATIEINGSRYTVEVDQTLTPVKTPKLMRTPAVPHGYSSRCF